MNKYQFICLGAITLCCVLYANLRQTYVSPTLCPLICL